ncbi:heterokaryon incompatibility protein-domain-containing protein [Podospora fimiseda]|uniref:Heterokaryon incompatibility protein-domain-containing protein n=1 Tax=Podospora fimiseda TaxID=252190 RepID=A0AAN7GU33_9PEZI|nr:heterokaryon incompatibility protein-domain-containing protein [Podospora fimiseda]
MGQTPSLPLPVPSKPPRCERCAGVDWIKLLNGKYPEYDEYSIHQLKAGPCLDCSLCRFFLEVIAYPREPESVTQAMWLTVSVGYAEWWTGEEYPEKQRRRTNQCTWGYENGTGVSTSYVQLPPVLGSNYGTERWSGRLRGTLVDYSLLREWVTQCCCVHTEECGGVLQSHSGHIKGLKVIDCETRQVILFPSGFDSKFAALSYVWGKTSTQLSPLLPGGILPRDLPNTIADAIEAAMKLQIPGLRYLLVDQYCIDQRDTVHKLQQISVMDRIYSSAFITFVAACSQNPSHGLPGVRPRAKQPRIEMGNTTMISGFVWPDQIVQNSKWFTRGWTYQECVFSRRRLIFTDDQVLFECNTLSRFETLDTPSQLRGSLICDLRFVWEDRSHGLWRHIRAYWKRELTFPEDVLNALTGVFSAFSKLRPFPIRQVFGIPIPTFLYYQVDPAVKGGAGHGKPVRFDDGSTKDLEQIFATSLLWCRGFGMPGSVYNPARRR